MFDKLIESNSLGADFRPRRRYFMASTFVVGILFLTALIASLYAADIDLGTDNFELTEMIAPLATNVPEPPRPAEPEHQRSTSEPTELPKRNANVLQIIENPLIPEITQVTPSTSRSRPNGRFELTRGLESDGIGAQGVYTGSSRGDTTGSGSLDGSENSTAGDTTQPEVAPPPVKKLEKKELPPRSGGVVNGIAIYLPKPAYPSVAIHMNIGGEVNVQVMIDEKGNVVSANAISGHSLLKLEAEKAARRAKFRPTLLTGVPVKVTGVIVYKFSRN